MSVSKPTARRKATTTEIVKERYLQVKVGKVDYKEVYDSGNAVCGSSIVDNYYSFVQTPECTVPRVNQNLNYRF